jgi:hypothetical protein
LGGCSWSSELCGKLLEFEQSQGEFTLTGNAPRPSHEIFKTLQISKRKKYDATA